MPFFVHSNIQSQCIIFLLIVRHAVKPHASESVSLSYFLDANFYSNIYFLLNIPVSAKRTVGCRFPFSQE